MKRRNFLKFLGLVTIAPKVAVDLLEKVQTTFHMYEDSLPFQVLYVSGTVNYDGQYYIINGDIIAPYERG